MLSEKFRGNRQRDKIKNDCKGAVIKYDWYRGGRDLCKTKDNFIPPLKKSKYFVPHKRLFHKKIHTPTYF